MTKPRLAAPMLALLLSAPSLQAFELPEGLTFTGYSELETLFTDKETAHVAHGRGDIGFRVPGSGSLSFGADIGFESIGYYADAGNAERVALYAELVVEGGFGALSLGQSRSAAERILDLPEPGGSRSVADAFGYATGPGLRLEHLYYDETMGLRYDGEIGGGRIAASINHMQGYGNIAQLAAEFPLAVGLIEGAIEADLPSDKYSVMLGGQMTRGSVDLGLYAYNDAYYGNGGSVRGFASYHVSEALVASAQMLALEGGQLYGLDVKYSLPIGLYGQLGVTDGSAIAERVTDLSIGFKF